MRVLGFRGLPPAQRDLREADHARSLQKRGSGFGQLAPRLTCSTSTRRPSSRLAPSSRPGCVSSDGLTTMGRWPAEAMAPAITRPTEASSRGSVAPAIARPTETPSRAATTESSCTRKCMRGCVCLLCVYMCVCVCVEPAQDTTVPMIWSRSERSEPPESHNQLSRVLRICLFMLSLSLFLFFLFFSLSLSLSLSNSIPGKPPMSDHNRKTATWQQLPPPPGGVGTFRAL